MDETKGQVMGGGAPPGSKGVGGGEEALQEVVEKLDTLIEFLQGVREKLVSGKKKAQLEAIQVLQQLQYTHQQARKMVEGAKGGTAEDIVREVFKFAENH